MQRHAVCQPTIPLIRRSRPRRENEQDDYETEWLDLEPGESVGGEVRAVRPNCGEYDNTVIERARGLGGVVAMWSNDQIDRESRVNDLSESDVVGIEHTEDTGTAENDAGEEYGSISGRSAPWVVTTDVVSEPRFLDARRLCEHQKPSRDAISGINTIELG